METTETGRFQLWEFLVSHRQLLLRRPATSSEPANVDLAFGGVKYVALPSSISNPRVRAATADEVSSAADLIGRPVQPDEVYVIEGDEGRGFVVAGSARRTVNDLELFESSLEQFADTRSAAERFERAVLLALAALDPEPEPALPSGGQGPAGLDGLLRIDGKAIGLEVKWISPGRPLASVRSRVIGAVERLDPWLDHLHGLLVVLGTHDLKAVNETQLHLTTAIGGFVNVRVVGWMLGDDRQELSQMARELAAA